METASWVICEKANGRPVFETFMPEIVAALNKQKYEAVPIAEYLARLNREIKGA